MIKLWGGSGKRVKKRKKESLRGSNAHVSTPTISEIEHEVYYRPKKTPVTPGASNNSQQKVIDFDSYLKHYKEHADEYNEPVAAGNEPVGAGYPSKQKNLKFLGL